MSVATNQQPLAPPAEGTILQIALDQIQPSPTNPRKSFDQASIDELAQSIASIGLLQPITVRPYDCWAHVGESVNPTPSQMEVKFEIIAGERRFRAVQQLGLASIDCIVREMTDEQALEAQIVENLQRKDVTAIEEANGFLALVSQLAAQGSTRTQAAEAVAKMIGKSVRHVWSRMKLTELVPSLQKDLAEGKFSSAHADELVRLCAKDQEEFRATHLYFGGTYENSKQVDVARSVRYVHDIIANQYQCDLAKPGFPSDDARLLPEAGSCSDCLKNTVNCPSADADAKKKATCMDRACFAKKRSAFVALEALKAKDKAAKPELVMVTTQHDLGSAHRKDKDAPKTRKQWKTAHANECEFVQPAVVMDISGLHGQAQAAKLVCANPKCKVHFGEKPESKATSFDLSSPASKKPTPEELAARRAEEAKEAAEWKARTQVFEAILGKVSGSAFSAQVLDLLIEDEARIGGGDREAVEVVAKYFGIKMPSGSFWNALSDGFKREGSKFTIEQKLRFFLALRLIEDLGEYGDHQLDEAAKKLDIDAKTIRAAAVQAPAAKKDLTPEQLASIADPKAAKKSTKVSPSPKVKKAAPVSKSAKSAKSKPAKKSAAKSTGVSKDASTRVGSKSVVTRNATRAKGGR